MQYFFKIIFGFFDPVSADQKRYEKFLSESTDLADLERRQKLWERRDISFSKYY